MVINQGLNNIYNIKDRAYLICGLKKALIKKPAIKWDSNKLKNNETIFKVIKTGFSLNYK